MKCREIISRLEALSPKEFAASWDNVGLMVGRKDKEVKKVYISLDATENDIAAAIEFKADMIINHHPLIFKPINNVTGDDYVGKRILNLIENDMCCYAMHTNFDILGMADAAADLMELRRTRVLDVTFEDEICEEGFGRVGLLPAIMNLGECAEYVKEVFELDYVKIFGDPDIMVELAAVSPGSGNSMIDKAVAAKADVLISGDIDYNKGLDAVEKNLMIIDTGHFGMEKLFMAYIEGFLRREFPGLEIATSSDEDPCKIV